MKKYMYVFLSFLLLIAGTFVIFNYKNSAHSANILSSESSEAVVIKKDSPEFKKTLIATRDDYYIGHDSAPVTVIEYASLSCPHCAHFHEDVVEPLIESHVNKGKVKYVFRDFPLNPPALEASLLARCFGKMRYFSLVKALFLSQTSWAADDYKTKLQAIVKPIGIDEAKYNECVGNKDNENAILVSRHNAEKILGVSSTPTIFINGIEYTGERNYSSVRKYIEGQLQGEK